MSWPLSVSAVLLWRALMAVALTGTASSTVFVGMALAAARRHLPLARVQPRAAASADAAALPLVSVLKPLHGVEPRLEETLETLQLHPRRTHRQHPARQ